ncbi:MAG: hypothetical protein ACR2K2_02085 [Mycobacteriales bacterium]
MPEPERIREIVLPETLFAQILEHGSRKLSGRYLPDEEQAPKAYGLLGGRAGEGKLTLTRVFPLRHNLRQAPLYKTYVDELMDEVAVPSETSLDKRGWVSDPVEVLAAERECDSCSSVLIGSYHMHRVPWAHDPDRDCCTELDTRLADGSNLWTLILSMVQPERPLLRAFFEGHNDLEAPVSRVPGEPLTDHCSPPGSTA